MGHPSMKSAKCKIISVKGKIKNLKLTSDAKASLAISYFAF